MVGLVQRRMGEETGSVEVLFVLAAEEKPEIVLSAPVQGEAGVPQLNIQSPAR